MFSARVNHICCLVGSIDIGVSLLWHMQRNSISWLFSEILPITLWVTERNKKISRHKVIRSSFWWLVIVAVFKIIFLGDRSLQSWSNFRCIFWDLLLNQNNNQREHIPLGQLRIVKRRFLFTDSLVDPCCVFCGPWLAHINNWTNPLFNQKSTN